MTQLTEFIFIFSFFPVLEDMETVKSSLDDALKKAIKEIKDRMESIKVDIRRIRNAREGEKESRRRVRREVVTYYEGFADQVGP